MKISFLFLATPPRRHETLKTLCGSSRALQLENTGASSSVHIAIKKTNIQLEITYN
jgi:hypothetical protein